MLLQHITDIIERVAPRSLQEEWDNSGLQVGNPTTEIQAALLTVDVTESVVSEAVSMGCNLIVSHHPLIFRGLKHLTGATPQERCVEMAIRNNIAIYSAHTNMDSVINGVSGRMAAVLGLTDVHILVGDDHGLGVIGTLPSEMDYNDFLRLVRDRFETNWLRYTPWDRPVRKIALCGGAGAEFTEAAIAAGADAFVTADVKYHEAQAAEGRIGLIDLDHWVSEHYTRDIFKELLEPHISCYYSSRGSYFSYLC